MSEQAALGSHLGLRRGGGRALLEVCVGSSVRLSAERFKRGKGRERDREASAVCARG